MADVTIPTPETIRKALAENESLRARELADSLGISEGQLVAAQVGHGAEALNADPDALIEEVMKLGEVMALTRTPSVVHEKVGVYENYRGGPRASMVINKDIDLRIFPSKWVSAFAVEVPGKLEPRRSIQVFDAAGDAVHKIHLRKDSNHHHWSALIEALRLDSQSDVLHVEARVAPSAPIERPERADELRREWDAMTDTHQFMRLTGQLKINRLGAYRMAGEPYVRRLDASAIDTLLGKLGDTGVPTMIFVGNHGCIQIHSGPVKRVVAMGPWNNVMDPGFNLHLRSDHVAEVYEVRKPTKRGEALSVEAFDKDGVIIVQIFGMRTGEVDHVAAFEELVVDLPGVAAVEVA